MLLLLNLCLITAQVVLIGASEQPWRVTFFALWLPRFEWPSAHAQAFYFRGETVILAIVIPLLPPPLPRLRGSRKMHNINDIKTSVNTVTQKWNVDVQFSVTFTTFDIGYFRMCTQLHRNESLKPNSLWHSQLLKSHCLDSTSTANALRLRHLLKQCGRK